jgi:hypothetical protein
MTPVAIKVLEYRRRAQKCRSLAENCPSLGERKSILQAADVWEQMAKFQERKIGIGESGLVPDKQGVL